MKFLERIEELKLENKGKILLVRCGVFVIATGNDAVFLSGLFGFKKNCLKPGVCKIGIPVTYVLKYLELIENKGYSYILFDYDKNTKELIEKYKHEGNKEVEKINFECRNCERYKEENFIDIFELLRRKEEEKNKKENKNE